MLQHSFTLLGLLKSSSNLNIFFKEFLYLCICYNNRYFLFDRMFFMCFWNTAAEHGPLFKWKLTSCEKREMLCSTRHACKTRIHSSLEQQFFLKCCSSSGWIWTDQYSLIGLMVGVRHTWFTLWDGIKLYIY